MDPATCPRQVTPSQVSGWSAVGERDFPRPRHAGDSSPRVYLSASLIPYGIEFGISRSEGTCKDGVTHGVRQDMAALPGPSGEP